MILSAHDCALSRWKDFFFACRTVVRTQAGLNVSEFILPLLILDRICFGSHTDQDLIRQEFLQVFSFESSSPMSMGQSDRQKAVSALFAVIDTLSYWSERETENRQRSSRSASSSTSRRRVSSKANDDLTSLTSWPADETITQIEELLSMIPLPVQASAADNVGMHARALRLLEMAARKSVVEHVFESSVDQQSKDVDCISGQTGFASIGNLSLAGIDVDLIKDVLARLDDCETMVGIGGGSFLATPLLQVKDSIRQKEAAGNFQAALQDYERALQVASIGDRDSDLQRGVLQCLLELGQFESVLNQVAGLIQKDADLASTKSFAVEAAWRLGRWQTLAGLIENEVDKDMPGANFDCYDTYQLSTGKAMLGIQRRETSKVLSAIRSGREVLLQNLSIFARESYARSYPEIVRLQCLRELENATEILCQDSNACNFTLDEIAHSTLTDGWAWDGRLDLATSRGASSVISTRVALARLSGDSVLEGSLFLNIGKRARKNGLFSIAENFFSQAEAAFSSIPPNKLYTNPKLGMLMDATRVQVAKLKHETGESTIALKMLGQEGVHRAFEQMLPQIQNAPKIQEIAVNYERQRITEVQGLSTSVTENKQTLTNRFASRILRLTQWTVEGGLKGGSEITGRFEIIHKLAPKWEKGALIFDIRHPEECPIPHLFWF